MGIVLKRVGKDPVFLDGSVCLNLQQRLVGGFVEYSTVRLGNRTYYMVYNEDGKFIGLPINFRLFVDSEVADVVAGDAFFIAVEDEVLNKERDFYNIQSYFYNRDNLKSQPLCGKDNC